MEALVARLLEDFEAGRMSRRELVRTLALGLFAAPVTAAVAAPGVAGAERVRAAAPWRTVGLDHISYAVTDYRRSAAFYSDLMGWEVLRDDGERQATLAIGDAGTMIVRNRRGPAPDAAGGVTGVVNHISFGIEPWDTDAVEEELKRRGLEPRPDMQGDDFKSFHVKDPDGWDLQISNQAGVDG